MKKTQVKFLALVASSLMSFSASAAEPCKAYVKLDLGYGMGSNTRVSGDGFISSANTPAKILIDEQLDKNQRGFLSSAGVGYAFNDAMRAEIALDFRPKMKANSNTFLVETRELGGSAKVFYDFNNNTSIVPFVFGGVGVVDIKPTIKPYASKISTWNVSNMAIAKANDDGTYVKDDAGNIQSYQSLNMKSKTVMTYTGGFGLSLTGSESVNIDLSYGIGGKASHVIGSNFASLNLIGAADTSGGSGGSGGSDVSGSSNTSGASISESAIDKSYIVRQIKFKNHIDQSLTLGIRITI